MVHGDDYNGCRRRQFWFVLVVLLSLLSHFSVCLYNVSYSFLHVCHSCRFCLTVVAFVLQLSLLSYSRMAGGRDR
jgi:hypothetical protein